MSFLSIADMLRLVSDECPKDPARAGVFHDLVREDAATGAPTSVQGQRLLATARDWPDMGERYAVGECCCNSSLCFQRAAAPRQEDVAA